MNEQGHSEAEMFALRSSDPADPVPFHAASSPTASKGAPPASNVSCSTSSEACPPPHPQPFSQSESHEQSHRLFQTEGSLA